MPQVRQPNGLALLRFALALALDCGLRLSMDSRAGFRLLGLVEFLEFLRAIFQVLGRLPGVLRCGVALPLDKVLDTTLLLVARA